MKKLKLIMTLVVIGSIFGQVQAQDNSKVGARLGGNFYNFRGTSSSHILGISADAFVMFDLSENFKIQSEIGYSGIGGKLKKGNMKVRLHYINAAPIIGKIFITENFNFEIGPKISYLVSCKNISKKNLKKFDFGAVAGFGFLLSDQLEISARYNLGLRNISKNNDLKMKNSGFQLSLSLRF